jgi:glycosyltransferase involved in cell wall biosynthesis
MRNANLPIEISVVSPVYIAAKTVRELVFRIAEVLGPMGVSYEIILVEDGSPDDSWQEIEKIAATNSSVKGVKLSRNFGQHQAITAGLRASSGTYTVVIDCDLQDDPIYIPMLYEKAKEGFPVVFTLKNKRAHGFFKNITARFFEFIFNSLINEERFHTRSDVGTYSILSRKVVNSFLKISDYHRHYLMVVRWLGFKEAYISIEHRKRVDGKSTYTITRLLTHAINGITSQSLRLLHLSIALGFGFVGLSFLSIVLLVIFYFTQGFREGWASIVILILLSTGCILLCLGITGLYLGKVFDQVRNRPLFLIDRTVNIPDDEDLEERRPR